MKKSISWVLAVFMVLALSACGGAPAQSSAPQPPDLTGVWKQTNSNTEEVYHQAEIQGNTIEIYWIDLESDTRALYWAGTFAAPETAEEPYSWDSENDHEKTDVALMSSTEDTKTFTYSDGQISYDMSIMGVDQTVVMEKQEGAVPKSTPDADSAGESGETGTVLPDEPDETGALPPDETGSETGGAYSLNGMNFIIPDYATYTVSDEDTDNPSIMIELEPNMRRAMILTNDMSSMSPENYDMLNQAMVASFMGDFDAVTKDDYTVSIAGETAQASSCIVEDGGSQQWVVLAFIHEGTQYVCAYVEVMTAEGDSADFFDMLQTITFDA